MKDSMKSTMRNNTSLLLFIILSIGLCGQSNDKHRVIVLTDIEADPDDTQSLVRLLLYANQIDIKGLIATTSCWLRNEVNPTSIEAVIKAYGKGQPNLSLHEKGYPTTEELMTLVKSSIPKYGMLGVGDGMDTEGSDWIIQELEKDDDRPLWISVWGGANTLAQALLKISKEKSPKEVSRLVSKLRVYTISDQDDSGIWMRNTYTELFYIVTPGDDYGRSTWNGILSAVPGIDNTSISNDWLAKNIQQGHGPLGANYPDVSWGMEGDTPAFLSLIPNGLNSPEYPNWGAWGGRYELYQPEFNPDNSGSAKSGVPWVPETRAIWTNASDEYTAYLPKAYGRSVKKDTTTFSGDKVSLWRWRDDFQHDFAARMDWCTNTYEEANHPPIPLLKVGNRITVRSGSDFTLDASPSYDPDGDNLSILWFPYVEAGSYKRYFKFSQPENARRLYGTAPEVAQKETYHVILRVTDKGTPALSRYQRVVITILP